jgi:deoxyribodipyrimidine photo-lyase
MRPLIWFRSDLRTADNPALHQACLDADRGAAAIFVITPGQWAAHDCAPVKVSLILRTLEVLSERLGGLNIPLLVRETDRFDTVPGQLLETARGLGCDTLYFNREYEVDESRRDAAAVRWFADAGLRSRSFTDQVLVEPGELRTGSGGWYRVFTPFRKALYRRLAEQGIPQPLGTPRRMPELLCPPDTVPDTVAGFETPDRRSGLWPAGEEAARARLESFVEKRLAEYHDLRDRPAVDGTSRISPYLASGAISVRQCLDAALGGAVNLLRRSDKGPATWISELVWREFYRHVLVGFPRVSMNRAFLSETEGIRWREDRAGFDAWREGRTGFPIVDAAMRQLLDCGWMHNRLRMISATFLAKDLFVDWRLGERHFMRHLIDGDLASNNGGWQWSASTGTDAAPYFRIFNPLSQSRKFDPAGEFIRRQLPELRTVSGPAIHDPSLLPAAERRRLDYPEPVVDHGAARLQAIAAFRELRDRSASWTSR